MYKMVLLKKVVVDDVYDVINSYVESNKVIIENYEGMVNTILRMTKDGYCFTMDRDLLRDAMESLTYMYAPSDDMNKDRVIQQFADEEEEEEDEDDDLFGGMDMMKMMQMMGGGPPPGGDEEEVVVKKEGSDQCCPETGENCQKECVEGECQSRPEVEQDVVDETNVDETIVPLTNNVGLINLFPK